MATYGYTKDGDLKPPITLGKLAEQGRSSQIKMMGDSNAAGHFTTSNMANNHAVGTSRMVVNKTVAPDKNRGSEPGVPWSSTDYPAREVFTTCNEQRTKIVSQSGPFARRDKIDGAKSTVKLGYKEAEAKKPFETHNADQYQDPQLGQRRAGATALDPPQFPAPKSQVNPITGKDREGPASCVFERYNPDVTKSRKSHDAVYKQEYNRQCTNHRFVPKQSTKYDNMMGYTVNRTVNPKNEIKSYPRPQLNSLGAVRPPERWNPVTQRLDPSSRGSSGAGNCNRMEVL